MKISRFFLIFLLFTISCNQKSPKYLKEIRLEQNSNLRIIEKDKIKKIIVYEKTVLGGQLIYNFNDEFVEIDKINKFIYLVYNSKNIMVKTFGNFEFQLVSNTNDTCLLGYNSKEKIITFQGYAFQGDLDLYVK